MERARAASVEDLPRVLELARELRDELRAMRGGGLWEIRDARVQPTKESFATLLTRDDATIVVGSIDDVILGYGTGEIEVLRDGTSLGIVGDLYVEPDARSVGVGEAIAEELIAYFTGAGCAGIDAYALPGHRQAKNFFERAGFTARALIMHKAL